MKKRAGWDALAVAMVVTAGAALAAWPTSTAVGLRTKRTTTPQPADTAAPSPTPPANALRRWVATNGGGANAQSPTLAQALAVARTSDLVLATKNSYPPYVAQMRQANPALRLVVYTNGIYAQSDQGSAYPDSWYARAADGSKVRSKKFGNYLMDPTSAGWIQSRVQTCAQWTAATHYDGCYLDMLGNATMGAGYDTAAPINAATHQPWSSTQWIAATSNLAANVVRANPSLLVVGNGLANGTQYFDPASGPTSTLLTTLPGANAQGFIRSESDAVTTFRSVSAWKNDINMLANAGQRGRFVMAMTKIDGNGTAAQVQQIHRYALASFLLGTDGTQYFYFSPNGNNDGINAPDTPDDHVDPGMPTAAYAALANGAYVRPFSGGYVAVNPTAAAVTVSLGATYFDLDGHAVQQAVLAPHSGMVFTTSSTVATPSTPSTTTTTPATTPACRSGRLRRCTPRRAP